MNVRSLLLDTSANAKQVSNSPKEPAWILMSAQLGSINVSQKLFVRTLMEATHADVLRVTETD